MRAVLNSIRNAMATTGSARSDLVVLLPGLWMPAWVMWPLAWRLRSRGLRCTCFGYPSMTGSLAENADRLAGFVRALPGAGPVHLVGHSLGGVLALHAMASRRLARVASIVMLGSPARGSHAAHRLGERRWGRRMLGRSLTEWLAAAQPVAPAGVAVGVIAGTAAFGLGMIIAPDLARPHDGVVRVAETVVSGVSERVEMDVSHSGMLLCGRVAQYLAAFIRHGHFEVHASGSRDAPTAPSVPGQGGNKGRAG